MTTINQEISDKRFIHYVDALRAGDLETCNQMRTDNAADTEILKRFRTVEQIWLCEMSRYIREVQIARRERDGHRAIAEGLRKLAEGDTTPPNGNACIRRGQRLLAQAEEAMVEHGEVEIPLGFTGV